MNLDGFKQIIERFKVGFFKFWKSDNSKISLIRDVLIAFVLVFIIVTGMWIYTGQ